MKRAMRTISHKGDALSLVEVSMIIMASSIPINRDKL